MLTAKNVTTSRLGGTDGYVNSGGSGMVKAVIDEFEITDANRGSLAGTGDSNEGVIMASLPPQSHIISVDIHTNLSVTTKLSIGCVIDVGAFDSYENILSSQSYTQATIQTSKRMSAGVSTKTLAELIADNNTPSGKGKLNSEGLVDIVLNTEGEDTTGTVTVVIQYI